MHEMHEKYAFIPTDKAANNIAIICKKYCVTVILKEILDAGNKTYEKINKTQVGTTQDDVEYNTRFKLSNGSKNKSFLII